MHFVKHMFIVTLLFLKESSCDRILCIASVPTFSHHIFFRPIWKALADRGHQLIVLTTNPMENPYKNITEIDLSHVYERKNADFNLPWTMWTYSNRLKIIEIYQNMYKHVAIMELDHPEVQDILLNETEHFDLVIAEMHIPLMFGFMHRFKCPLIGVSSSDISIDQHSLLGNPTHPLIYPDTFTPRDIDYTFRNRALTLYFQIMDMFREARQRPIWHDILKKYFGPDVPSIDDLTKSLRFVLINTLFNVRPFGPKFVMIGGGIHIEKIKELPTDLQVLLDNSPQGVVYFSLGTNIKIQQYPPNFINATIEAFSELPYQIIWKFNYEIANIPKNLKVFQWLPQQDLLRHPKLKVFITQGGLHSVEESIHAEVPMIGIPFMSDQSKNVKELEDKGMAVYLKKEFSKNDLKNAIMEVAENKRYKHNVIAMSRLLKDQPMTGLEKAVWYVEYALRHKEYQEILPSLNDNLPFYQYYFLDVIGSWLLSLYISGYLAFKLFKILIRLSKGPCRDTKNKTKIN